MIQLGRALGKGRHRLIYGGASVGLMGVLADEVLAQGGIVHGILPKQLKSRESAHPRLESLEIVSSMSVRKERLIELADAFIVGPGGLGTLDELFEVLTGIAIGLYDKPVGILNIAGCWDRMLEMIQEGEKKGFIPSGTFESLEVEEDPNLLLDRILKRLDTSL